MSSRTSATAPTSTPATWRSARRSRPASRITYKILYNDAVAMTGGQPVDGKLGVGQITRQVWDEGVRRIVVVSDEPAKHGASADLAPGVEVHDRHELDRVQRELRDYPGVSVLVYDQTCAAEKRRRRKHGKAPEPARRAFINELVCEGCGDCSKKSNCLSVVPLDTELGTKRAIDQSSCNTDLSCVDGFCPSFVTVEGGTLRKPLGLDPTSPALAPHFAALPLPVIDGREPVYDLLVTGVGGTGVLTVGAVVGMAAHLEGRGATVLDFTGLAQKGGAVLSHVRIARPGAVVTQPRIEPGDAEAVIACDLVVAAGAEARRTLRAGVSRVVASTHAHAHRRPHPRPVLPDRRGAPRPPARAGGQAGAGRPGRRAPPGARGHGRRHRRQRSSARLRLAEGPGAGRPRGARAGDRA